MFVQVVYAGVFDLRIPLRDDADELVGRKGVFDELQTRVAPDGDRQHDAGEKDGVAKRQDGQFDGNVGLLHLLLFVARGEGNALFGIVRSKEERLDWHVSVG